MADTITLYTNPMSRGLTVHWLLEELGVPYEREAARFRQARAQDAGVSRDQSDGQGPRDRASRCRRHGGRRDLRLSRRCVPAGQACAGARRSAARHVLALDSSSAPAAVEPAVVDKMFARPPVERSGAIGYGTYDSTLTALETALTPGPFILGNRFSAADIYVGSQIYWGLQAKGIEPRAVFEQYAGRCTARPAFQRVFGGVKL